MSQTLHNFCYKLKFGSFLVYKRSMIFVCLLFRFNKSLLLSSHPWSESLLGSSVGVPFTVFADDCFFFCRASVVEAHKPINILKTYEIVFGKEINLSKSKVFFTRNMSLAVQKDLSSILGVRLVMRAEKYLGLPSTIARDKVSIFHL